MLFGLVGTGHRARVTHAPALLAAPDVTLAGVWGREIVDTLSQAQSRLG